MKDISDKEELNGSVTSTLKTFAAAAIEEAAELINFAVASYHLSISFRRWFLSRLNKDGVSYG